MGKSDGQSDPCRVIIATLEDLPVRNTFIHFPAPHACHRTSCLHRSTTDPSSEPRSRSQSRLLGLVSPLCQGSVTDAHSQFSATASDSTASNELIDETGSSADSVVSSEEGDDVMEYPSTPVSSPCWARTMAPSGSMVQLPSWTPSAQTHANFHGACSGSVPSPALQAVPGRSHPTSPYTVLDDGRELFTFTHRRAEGWKWGLGVRRDEIKHALVVDAVLPGGAIDAWNKQVMDGPMTARAVRVGDLIVSVNAKRDCLAMLDESNSRALLKIEVVRENVRGVRGEKPRNTACDYVSHAWEI